MELTPVCGSVKTTRLCAGSRNRTLSFEYDNAGFYSAIHTDKRFIAFFNDHPGKRLYGEWLVPHTLKTYKKEAWNKLYVFDVLDESGEFMSYSEYAPILEAYEIEYVPCIAVAEYPVLEKLYHTLNQNTYLLEDGKGIGEGVVLKNYSFKNKFGRIAFAKMITTEFKEKFHKVMGPNEIKNEYLVEEKIANKYVSSHLVDKIIAKIVNDTGAFSSRDIPRLLHTVYYDVVREELWEALKEFDNPKIDFKELQRQIIRTTKGYKPELFGTGKFSESK